MNSGVLLIALGGILYYYYRKAYNYTQESFMKEATRNQYLSRENQKTKGYEELANEAVDPGTTTYSEKHAPVQKEEVGPFGVKRQMRKEPGTDFWVPTFGRSFFENY